MGSAIQRGVCGVVLTLDGLRRDRPYRSACGCGYKVEQGVVKPSFPARVSSSTHLSKNWHPCWSSLQPSREEYVINPSWLGFSSGMGADGSSTARVQRGIS